MKTLRHFPLLLCFISVSAFADWNNWRGPDFNLNAGKQDFPSNFSDSKNVLWSVAVPGEGTSTPAIWKDTLYITSLANGMDTLMALNIDGKLKWNVQLGEGREGSHRQGTGANSSPVVDGSGIYVYFKSGTLAKLSHAGKELWKTNLLKKYSIDTHWWDEGSSPVLEDGKVFVAVMQQRETRQGDKGDAYIVAFDANSGKEIWHVKRNLDAPVESNDAYTTPLIATVDGQKQLVIWGADQLTGHSLKDGKTIWNSKGFNPNNHKNWRTIASHTIKDDIAIVPFGRGYAVAAVRMSGKGDITEKARLWEIKDIGPDVPTPAIFGNLAIILNDRGAVTAVDIESGDIAWQDEFPRKAAKYFASPVIAGNRLIGARYDGAVLVAEISKKGMKFISENSMGENESVIATPIPHNDRLYVRTSGRLYCIANNS